jgi:hypothetical protein
MKTTLLLLVPSLLSGCVFPALFTGATLAPALTGKVVDQHGTAVAQASVERTISGDDELYSRIAQTDSEGGFEFDPLYVRHRYYVVTPPLTFAVPNTVLMRGQDQLRVSKEGYQEVELVAGAASPAAGNERARTVEVELDEL